MKADRKRDGKNCEFEDLSVSHWCCWRLSSFDVWHCVTGKDVPDILIYHGAFMFWVK